MSTQICFHSDQYSATDELDMKLCEYPYTSLGHDNIYSSSYPGWRRIVNKYRNGPMNGRDPFNEIFDEICVMLDNFHITTPSTSPSPSLAVNSQFQPIQQSYQNESYPYNPFDTSQLSESLTTNENNPYNKPFAYRF